MKDEVKQRMRAVRRFLAGENPEAICASMGRSRAWLYRWFKRYSVNDDAWCNSQLMDEGQVNLSGHRGRW